MMMMVSQSVTRKRNNHTISIYSIGVRYLKRMNKYICYGYIVSYLMHEI